ncbi:MAG: diaminopimelate decarboxylase [Deltaproteobacteria bacterium]|nr:diaminopimelate decarboxylase [Deltaproteobacteria bacterium]
MPSSTDARPFWCTDFLGVGPLGLELAGLPLGEVACEAGTPLYVYSRAAMRRQIAELRGALERVGRPYRIQYAMKANRASDVLRVMRDEGDVAIDACSPREVARALEHGFGADEISVTAGMLSGADLARFAQFGVHLNLDTRSVLRRWAETPGRSTRVGLRINPEVSIGWGEEPKLQYGNSKFGFDGDEVLAAVAYATSLGLEIDTLHVHCGWGLQASAAPALREVYRRLRGWAEAIPTVRVVNVGGGLCPRYRAEDDPLTPATWGELLAEAFGDSALTIACEPGTFVVAPAGVLLCEVNTVEPRRSGVWVGLDAGHNANVFAAHYGIPMAILKVAEPLAPASERYHLAGNINEANDVFARGRAMPVLAEGDRVAFWPAGAYGTSMASDHCMRGIPREIMI